MVFEKFRSVYFFQIAQEKSCDYLLIIYVKKFRDEQKKRTRITQSGKNCAINCAIQGVRLIWKQKIWYGHLWVSLIIEQSERLVSFLFLFWINSFLHCSKKNCSALNQSEWRIFFMYIIMEINLFRRLAERLSEKLTIDLEAKLRGQLRKF